MFLFATAAAEIVPTEFHAAHVRSVREGPLGALLADHFVLRCRDPGAGSFAPPGAV